MDNLIIEETKTTPLINLDAQNREITLRGKSYPENTFEFYAPMMSWIEEYFESDILGRMVVNLEIIYFNSSSSKLFFDFFDLLEEAHNQGKRIEINWICNVKDEYTIDVAEDFKEDFEELNFNIIVK